ncbi:hypothetical protein P7C70_g9600, partial [Phenoliferia sp. Uapishka_3]
MATTYSISPLAYLKVILHAGKWHGTVTGLLLGTFDLKTKAAVIQDAIPLLHHWTDLSPMMEAGLQLVSFLLRISDDAPHSIALSVRRRFTQDRKGKSSWASMSRMKARTTRPCPRQQLQ